MGFKQASLVGSAGTGGSCAGGQGAQVDPLYFFLQHATCSERGSGLIWIKAWAVAEQTHFDRRFREGGGGGGGEVGDAGFIRRSALSGTIDMYI